MRYHALLVDLDGVLRRWRTTNDAIETASGLPVGAIFKVAFSPEYLMPAITGMVTDEEWRTGTTRQLELVYPSCDAEAAVRSWSASPGDVDTDILDILLRCDARVRLVLVTNATSRLSQDLTALGLAARFHAIVNSSEIGVAKPADEFYRIALARAGVPAEQALFVDDSLSNVVAATARGIRAHHFTGHRELLDFLEHSGVLGDDTH